MSVLLFGLVLVALRDNGTAVTLWCVASVGLVTFLVIVYPQRHVRFSGFVILVLIGCCWYAVRLTSATERATTRETRLDVTAFGVVGVLAIIQVGVAVVLTAHFADGAVRQQPGPCRSRARGGPERPARIG